MEISAAVLLNGNKGGCLNLPSALRSALFVLAVGFYTAVAFGDEVSPGCRWSGPTPEKVMAMHLSPGEISGTLGIEIMSYLQRNGIPISFISEASGDSKVHLEISTSTFLRQVLDEIERQSPGYRYGIVDKRLVIYPRLAAYDDVVNLAPLRGELRASALYSIIRELRVKSAPLKNLESPTLRGPGMGWGKNFYSDTLDVGGAHSVVEHLVSLLGKRPALAFRILPVENGNLSFGLNRVPLLRKVEAHVPATVVVGAAFSITVTATLVDGTVVTLEGAECGVNYGASGGGVLEVDETGRAIARKKGIGSIEVQYENRSASARVSVQ